jgi:hypothetical protein
MIKAPSVQREYTFIWSGDPALSLPTDDDERARVLKVSRDTGDWSPLVAAGKQPTLFTLAHLSRTEIGWWEGERSNSPRNGGRPLSSMEASDLLVRLALHSVENFKGSVQRRNAGPVSLADESIINAIFEKFGAGALAELADAIVERALNPIRPL